MDLTNFDDLRTAMKLAGISPRKGLGQHFLIDRPSLDTIVGAAELSESDTILEIGPGLGVMTEALAQFARRVVAVETDKTLADLLRRRQIERLEVVDADFLTFDLSQLPSGYKVVANIPYYLTSKIFRLLLESPNPPASITVLIQKEVAERIVAGPGDMSILALSIQYYGQPQLVAVVERHKFWPAPEVDSAVLHVVVDGPAFPAEVDRLFRLIKAGFGEKRKQLKNSLAGGLNTTVPAMVELLEAAKIAPQARAQELDLADWERLYGVAVNRELL